MSDAEKLGLMMLTWVSHRDRPAYHSLSSERLRQLRHEYGRDVNMLAGHVAECRLALAEAEREHVYQADQLEWVSGILEVRKLCATGTTTVTIGH